MFDALGRLTYERRWLVLAAATAFMVFALLWGSGVLPELKGGGFEQQSSDSARQDDPG
jgi:hypothetical protein